MTKQIQFLAVDESIETRDIPPTWAEMQAYVGGDVEQVRVLDRIEGTRLFYSWMYVNVKGLLKGLPRNAAATALYQRNVRLAFSGHPNPFLAAKAFYQAQAEAAGATVLSTIPLHPDYDADPWIAGPAIYFQGWTCEEVTASWHQDEEEEDEA